MKIIKAGISLFILWVLFMLTTISVQADTVVVDDITISTDGTITTVLRADDTYYVGGSFEEISVGNLAEVQRANLAEINLTNQSVSTWNPNPDGPVQDIVLYQNNLIISGQFTRINDSEIAHIVQINEDSKTTNNLQLVSNGAVYGLLIQGDTLYVSGSFTQLNGQPRIYLGSYNLQQNKLTDWNPSVNNTVYDIAGYNNTIYIGGAFTEVNGFERQKLAAFDNSSGELLEWDPSSDLVITNLSPENNTIVVTGFLRSDEGVQAKKVSYNSQTGEKVNEETIDVDEVTTSAIWKDETMDSTEEGLMVDQAKLGFKIPSLSDILTFAIRAFFVIAGLAALFFLLLGAFAWVTSGGDQDSIGAARDKIQAAVVGLLMMVFVLAIVWTLEQVIFNRRICLGLSCPVTIPALLQPAE